jgi:hypothetical protein
MVAVIAGAGGDRLDGGLQIHPAGRQALRGVPRSPDLYATYREIALWALPCWHD